MLVFGNRMMRVSVPPPADQFRFFRRKQFFQFLNKTGLGSSAYPTDAFGMHVMNVQAFPDQIIPDKNLPNGIPNIGKLKNIHHPGVLLRYRFKHLEQQKPNPPYVPEELYHTSFRENRSI
jgi:hypothetical protein